MTNPTTPIKQMDREAAKALSAATSEALQAVAERFGVTVKVGGGKYDPDGGTFAPKVEFVEADGPARQWALDAPLFGLEADDFGAEFTSRGRRFRITGLNLRARSMPITATDVANGKGYKFPAEGVKRALVSERAKSHE